MLWMKSGGIMWFQSAVGMTKRFPYVPGCLTPCHVHLLLRREFSHGRWRRIGNGRNTSVQVVLWMVNLFFNGSTWLLFKTERRKFLEWLILLHLIAAPHCCTSLTFSSKKLIASAMFSISLKRWCPTWCCEKGTVQRKKPRTRVPKFYVPLLHGFYNTKHQGLLWRNSLLKKKKKKRGRGWRMC